MEIPRNSETYYDSASRGTPALEELREIFNYRNLILQLTRRDITARYKRSVLGIAWTMLNPLGMMIVLSIAFSHIFKFETEFGYPAFVLSGILSWNFFSQTTTAAMVNLVWGGGILHRIYIPRTSFAIAAIATGLVNFLLATVPLFLIMMITGVPLRPTILFLPVSMILLASFALGVGLLISTFAVYYPDVSEMYSIAMYGWMYLSPVIYPIDILPENFRFWITHLNPMYFFIELYRLPIYYGRMPTLDIWLPAVLISLITLVVGWIVFTIKADEFSYRI